MTFLLSWDYLVDQDPWVHQGRRDVQGIVALKEGRALQVHLVLMGSQVCQVHQVSQVLLDNLHYQGVSLLLRWPQASMMGRWEWRQ